jgi:methionine aminopeptidase
MAASCALPLASLARQPSKRMVPWRSQRESPPQSTFSLSSRTKSSIPSPSNHETDSPSDIYDRAHANATSFDIHYNLPSSTSWKPRQMAFTQSNFLKPYPRSPPNLIRPSPNYHPNFFPSYAHNGRLGPPSLPHDTILIHDAESISNMRNAARLARKLLDVACSSSVSAVGTTTEQIDDLVRDAALANNAYPSPLNYMGFPKSVCSSINEVVCHGIPDTRPLELGDVVSFDVSCFIGGVHGDNCATVIVGDYDDNNENVIQNMEDDSSSSPYLDKDWRCIRYKTQFGSDAEEERFVTARRLVQAAIESRDEGVKACKPGGCLSDVGAAIHAVADAYGYDTVRHYRGHGISSDFHCAPFVKVRNIGAVFCGYLLEMCTHLSDK